MLGEVKILFIKNSTETALWFEWSSMTCSFYLVPFIDDINAYLLQFVHQKHFNNICWIQTKLWPNKKRTPSCWPNVWYFVTLSLWLIITWSFAFHPQSDFWSNSIFSLVIWFYAAGSYYFVQRRRPASAAEIEGNWSYQANLMHMYM